MTILFGDVAASKEEEKKGKKIRACFPSAGGSSFEKLKTHPEKVLRNFFSLVGNLSASLGK